MKSKKSLKERLKEASERPVKLELQLSCFEWMDRFIELNTKPKPRSHVGIPCS